MTEPLKFFYARVESHGPSPDGPRREREIVWTNRAGAATVGAVSRHGTPEDGYVSVRIELAGDFDHSRDYVVVESQAEATRRSKRRHWFYTHAGAAPEWATFMVRNQRWIEAEANRASAAAYITRLVPAAEKLVENAGRQDRAGIIGGEMLSNRERRLYTWVDVIDRCVAAGFKLDLDALVGHVSAEKVRAAQASAPPAPARQPRYRDQRAANRAAFDAESARIKLWQEPGATVGAARLSALPLEIACALSRQAPAATWDLAASRPVYVDPARSGRVLVAKLETLPQA
jgi:hypothetical protein